MIQLVDIGKVFNKGTPDQQVLFDHFNFEASEGSFVSIVGSNGSGKTTMLNLLAGTLAPDSGRILLDGSDITRQKEHVRARRIGRVFQNPSAGVAENLTVAENLALAANKGKPYNLSIALNKKHIQQFRELVAPIGLGLEDKMSVRMGSLSGGQRQSISLIMATMTPIDILILDEHTAALDPKTADIIMQFTDEVVRQKHLTTLMVTHNLRYAVQYGDRLVMMHEGNVVYDKQGEDKKTASVDELLGLFNSISIECGN